MVQWLTTLWTCKPQTVCFPVLTPFFPEDRYSFSYSFSITLGPKGEYEYENENKDGIGDIGLNSWSNH